MATVRMVKGNKYADIFDSPETIEQAKKDGPLELYEAFSPVFGMTISPALTSRNTPSPMMIQEMMQSRILPQ